jgi:hypothetical protein
MSTAEPAAKSNTGGAEILRAFLFSRRFRASPVAERVGRTKGCAPVPSIIHVVSFYLNLNCGPKLIRLNCFDGFGDQNWTIHGIPRAWFCHARLWGKTKQRAGKQKKGHWMETAVNLLIRPPRNEYLPSQLGPTQFTIAGRRYRRHDLEVQPPPPSTLRPSSEPPHPPLLLCHCSSPPPAWCSW